MTTVNKFLTCLAMGTLCIFTACSKDEGDDMGETFKVEVLSPVAVAKTETKKIFVHLMPWFENKATNNGNWGQHWTMSNQNPDNIVDASTGRRQIASHFYPLIGPYASSDKKVVEYQLLLMKMSGIDGVLIDWYGTINHNDYPANLKNSEAFISLVKKVGLQYAIVYEDNTVQVSFDAKKISDKIAAAKADMTYMEGKYFSGSEYIKINGKPLLMTFGPRTFQSSSDWTSIFSVLSVKPTFLTLWGESNEGGTNAAGEYAWVYQSDSQTHLEYLDNFYNGSASMVRVASAYPGFKDFYEEGGWGSGYFMIDHNDTETFETTLNKALDSDLDYIQLATWNDYGEGTMIEPTLEFGYSYLNMLQSKLGVAATQSDLDLVARLYEIRKQNESSSNLIQKKLDQVFYYLVSLQKEKAAALMDELD